MTPGERDLRARAVVRAVRSLLPPELARHAAEVGVAFDRIPARRWISEGVQKGDLGLFSGPSMRDPDAAESDEAPRITLFLDNIWHYAGRDPDSFAEEVERTFLHELGHFFGFEECDMPSRDLD